MKYIFGLGLPRTGSNSLGSALHLLGINGECKCILNNYQNKRFNPDNKGDYKYIIYNDAYQELDILLTADKMKDNKYILTSRNHTEWVNSIKNFKLERELCEELSQMNMNDYKDKIIKLFEINDARENLLIIDVFADSDEKLWTDIATFLGKEDIAEEEDLYEEEFPKINLNK